MTIIRGIVKLCDKMEEKIFESDNRGKWFAGAGLLGIIEGICDGALIIGFIAMFADSVSKLNKKLHK